MNPIQEYFYRIAEPERSTLLFAQKDSGIRHRKYYRDFEFWIAVFKYKRKCCAICITAKSISSIT